MSIGTAIFFVGMGLVGVMAGGVYSFVRIWRAEDERWQEEKRRFDEDMEETRESIRNGGRPPFKNRFRP